MPIHRQELGNDDNTHETNGQSLRISGHKQAVYDKMEAKKYTVMQARNW